LQIFPGLYWMAAVETKKVEEDEETPAPPSLLRQLSVNSQQLLTKAFDQLDKDGRGYITRKEAVDFYETFSQAKSLSLMGAILRESAKLMITEFDKRNGGPGVVVATGAAAVPVDGGASKETAAVAAGKPADKEKIEDKHISFDEWAEFFQKLQIPDEKLEEILNQFV